VHQRNSAIALRSGLRKRPALKIHRSEPRSGNRALLLPRPLLLSFTDSLSRFLQTDPVGYKDDINWYAYVGNDPTDKTDPTGECPECLFGAAVEIGFQLYTGELQKSFSDAAQGHYEGLAVSAGKIGVSALSGGLSSTFVKGGVSLAVKGAELAGAGQKAITAAKVAGVVAGQSTNGALTKVGTNALEGKPLQKDVGTAAVVSGGVGTVGHYASAQASSAAGVLGSNGAAVAKIATKAVTGEIKKETNCSINHNQPC
jgi:hypothetical protein